MLRLLFALVGYVCTATVIAAAIVLFHLRNTDQLTDEKMFRIVALLHDVDLVALADELQAQSQEVPPEEPSPEQLYRHRDAVDRNLEVKTVALERGRREFDHRLQLLQEKTERYDKLAQEWSQRLDNQGELTTKESVEKVVQNLQSVKPETAKELLVRMLDEGRSDDVIILMNQMTGTKLKKILQRFQTDDELNRLHGIHRLLMQGYPNKPALDQARRELDSLLTEDN